jgi:hypothetical protein
MLTRAQAAEFVNEAADEDTAHNLEDAATFLRNACDALDSVIDEFETAEKYTAGNQKLVAECRAMILALDAIRAASPLHDIADELRKRADEGARRFIRDDDGKPGTARLTYASNI